MITKSIKYDKLLLYSGDDKMIENINTYLKESIEILKKIDQERINDIFTILKEIQKKQSRLFILGVGGSAANASHAVNDFRKIAGIESYAPTDNIAELTARINDDGWDTSYVNWLKGSRLNKDDCVMVLSVGGGNVYNNISMNLVEALKYAKDIRTKIVGIVSRDGGFTAKVSDACVIIPIVNIQNITPHAEEFQSMILHLLVTIMKNGNSEKISSI